jgi:hypothetical protein
MLFDELKYSRSLTECQIEFRMISHNHHASLIFATLEQHTHNPEYPGRRTYRVHPSGNIARIQRTIHCCKHADAGSDEV